MEALFAFLISTFGDNGALAVTIITFVIAVWSQARQILPASWFAKLPHWVIWIFELMAGNKGQSQNAPEVDPSQIKDK